MVLILFGFVACVVLYMIALHFLTASLINYKFQYRQLAQKQFIIGIVILAIDLIIIYACLR
jgi:uncharacterized membrane protein YesL